MTTREDASNKLAYWRGYRAALYAVKSIADFKTEAYIDTEILPRTDASIQDAEETLAIFDKEVNQ